MNIVAIETATETVGVAVRTDAGVQAEFSLVGRRRHVESLAPALTHLLDQVGLVPADLGVVAVDLGPGLFTGLRVGVSTAKGLAQALGIGVVGLSSLEVLMGAAAGLGHRGLVLAAVDARRGEVFAEVQEVTSPDRAPRPVVPSGLFAPDALADALAGLGGEPVLAVGDGAQRYTEALGGVAGVTCVMDALAAPPATTLLTLALRRLDAGATPLPADQVVPHYGREADARSNFTQIERTAARSTTAPG